MLRRWLELRRWRKSVKPGDWIRIGIRPIWYAPVIVHQQQYKVHIVDDGEVTVFVPFLREYETYKTNKIYPPNY